MAYTDNEKKFVCVLNVSIPIPMLMNALGHTTAGLAAYLDTQKVTYIDYRNDADGFVAKIPLSPFIVLKAKNSNQLATLRAAAQKCNIAHNIFVSSMIGNSAEEQVTNTLVASGISLEYWAITLFGYAGELSPITKKFSLFSANVPDTLASN